MKHYTLIVHGILDQRWAEWFDGLTLTALPSGETQLSGPLPDQAALYGLLNRLRDLGLELTVVQSHEAEPGADH
jgi:hypothetical protein